jgi:transposase-like protein
MAKFDPDNWEEYFGELNEGHERGEISYRELNKLGEAGLRKMEKQCPHKNRKLETFKNGSEVEWCEDCGAAVQKISGGTLAAAGKKSDGCVVLALGLLGVAAAGIWGLIEAVQTVFG